MCQQQRTDLIWTHYSALTASLWIPPIKDKPARSLDAYIPMMIPIWILWAKREAQIKIHWAQLKMKSELIEEMLF